MSTFEDESHIFFDYFGPDFIEQVVNKFNVDPFFLKKLGEGYYGTTWGIDEWSILKITDSDVEKRLVLTFIERGLTLEPGYVSIIPDDYLDLGRYFIYRRERLCPYASNIDLSEVETTNGEALRDIRLIDRLGVDLRQGIEISREATVPAKVFLKKTKIYFDNPLYTAIILFMYEAALEKMPLWDLDVDNLGFRYKEDRETPDVVSGFVFFDPMAEFFT